MYAINNLVKENEENKDKAPAKNKIKRKISFPFHLKVII